MSAIVKSDGDALATISDDQVKLLSDTIAKGASKDELSLFVGMCNRLGLDPFARQIYLVKRWDGKLRREVAIPQVSIDGFRLVAERTKSYAGQTAPMWCGEDGKWVDVWLKKEPPAAAKCGVYRAGFAEPLVRVARYESYVQRKSNDEPTKFWKTMPDVMLAKCAESLALRAAFPNDLSGIYTAEEMGQAETPTQTLVEIAREGAATVVGAEPPRREAKVVSKTTVADIAVEEPKLAAVAEKAAEAFPDAYAEIFPTSAPTPPPGDPYRFTKGEHAGKTASEVPHGYLHVVRENKNWSRAPKIARDWVEYEIARFEWEIGK